MSGSRGARGINLGFGFNLIGLLLVVVILGVSAAITVSSLGGNTPAQTSGTVPGATTETTTGNIGAIAKQSAVVACESDATEVDTAIQEYSTVNGVAPDAVTPTLLTSGPAPDLVAFPSSPDFTISIASGVVMIAAPKTSVPVAYGTAGACAQAGP